MNANATGITDAQRSVVKIIRAELPEGTYLAGGVAVALRLHHRLSVDLDLFVPDAFESERLEEQLASSVRGIRATGRARGTLHFEADGIPVSILSYRYPMLSPPLPHPELLVPVASLEDLAAMKLSAIAGRGAAKDFWDLDEMLVRSEVASGSVEGALELYARKFVSSDSGHVVRSLAYFAEADAAPLPAGLTAEHWLDVKARFVDRVRALG